MAEPEQTTAGAEDGGRRSAARAVGGITPRSVIISLVVVFLCVFWIRQAELLSFTCQITESVPPIPALAVLLLYAAIAPLLRRMAPRWVLTRAELGVIFVFVGIGTVMSAVGVTQAFLPYQTVPFYFQGSDNNFDQMCQHLPSWTGPRDPEVIRTFFEGLDVGGTPWPAWSGPLAWWLLFFVAFWFTATCIFVLFRAQWSERERLTYPLVSIPVSLIEERPTAGEVPLLRNRMMWLGFGVVLVFHVMNVLHIVNPSVAAPGPTYALGQFFTERPLDALSGISIWHRPELVGLGYLVPLDILFSVWFFFVLEQVAAVLGRAGGFDTAGYPFDITQGMGAYIAMALFLVFMARRHLADVLRRAWSGTRGADDRTEALPYRIAVPGAAVGFAVVTGFAIRAGVAPWVALLFFGLLFAFQLTYCRIRCESGTPAIWVLPHTELRLFPFQMLGSDAFKVGGSFSTLSSLTSFYFLVHGGFFNQTTIYQMESFRLADELGMRKRQMVGVGIAAVAIGLVLAFWMFLWTYYSFGTNVLAGGSTSGTGGVRIAYCLQSWQQTSGQITLATTAERPRHVAALVGFLVTVGLLVTRAVMLRSWLSPLGYIMATINGMQLWWSFLLAWIAKAAILRLGGVTLYRRMVPLFLGLALGQFFIGGVVWGTLAIFFRDISYVIWFT